jgi:hypothetical protein
MVLEWSWSVDFVCGMSCCGGVVCGIGVGWSGVWCVLFCCWCCCVVGFVVFV